METRKVSMGLERIDRNHFKIWIDDSDYWVVCGETIGQVLISFQSFSIYRADWKTTYLKEYK